MRWEAGSCYRSWRVIARENLEEYESLGIHLRHDSGLELFHVQNDNSENLFAFSFKTMPTNNTGVAHILEHTVLCGSKKYPVKDPFLALIKSSLSTFLNAFTFPDKTVYVASSAVEADFFNLMRVYADAVFHPLLQEEAFHQEGWHFKLDDSDQLSVSGIVYNEMKGAYSSSETLMQEFCIHSLFDQGVYSFDSGGKPEEITQLSYEEFLAFYKKFYHPQNTKLFTFGNIPLEKYLDFLEDEVLSKQFPQICQKLPAIKVQKRWKTPKKERISIPLKEDGSLCSVLINWLTADISKSEDVLGLQILSQILLSDASPVVLGLLKEGYAEGLSPLSGYESEIRDTLFTLGARGVKEEKKELIYDFILQTLKQICETGLDTQLVEGIFFNFEFSLREVKGSGQGLKLMRRTLKGWLHELPPEHSLVFKKHLKSIKRKWREEAYFEKLIKHYLLDNPHHSCLIFEPNPHWEKEQYALSQKWLKEQSLQRLPYEREKILTLNKQLDLFQQKEESAQLVNVIPIVKKEELPHTIRPSVTFFESEDLGNVYGVNLKTNGIVYVNLFFSLTHLSEDKFPLLGLFHRSWDCLGTYKLNQEELEKQLRINFGHFYFSLHYEENEQKQVQPWLCLTLATTAEKRSKAMNLLREILFNAHWKNTQRLQELLLEIKSDFASSLVDSGHRYAESLALSNLHPLFRLKEGVSGITAYRYWLKASQNVEESVERLQETFADLTQVILNINTVKAFVITEEESQRRLWQKEIQKLLKEFSPSPVQCMLYPTYKQEQNIQAIIASTKVSFNAQVFKGVEFEDEDYPTVNFISHLLKSQYLWQKVRMQGGAYGATAIAYSIGYFSCLSYRDPHTQKTLDAFQESLEELSRKRLSEKEIYSTLIGMLGNDLAPISPNAYALSSFKLKQRGISDEKRQQVRNDYFKLDSTKITRVAMKLLEQQKKAVICSFTSEDLLKREPFRQPIEKILL